MGAVFDFGEVKHLGHLELVGALMVALFKESLKRLQFFFSVNLARDERSHQRFKLFLMHIAANRINKSLNHWPEYTLGDGTKN